MGACHLLGHSVAVGTQISRWTSAHLIQHSFLCQALCQQLLHALSQFILTGTLCVDPIECPHVTDKETGSSDKGGI